MRYRIYYVIEDQWNLWSAVNNEDLAWERWNECCDRYPEAKIVITKETIIKQSD